MRVPHRLLALLALAGACKDAPSPDDTGAPPVEDCPPERAVAWHLDGDGDGFGDRDDVVMACEAPPGRVAQAGDCDDALASVNPAAPEVCDGLDNDCDGRADSGAVDAPTWLRDADGDGYGDPGVAVVACVVPEGFVQDASDCDDGDPAVSPAGVEVCNGVDDDCDGEADEPDAVDAATWYADADNDGFGDPAAPLRACAQPRAAVSADRPGPEDCDDAEPTVNPGAEERCDGLDNDCDGLVDGGWRVPADHPTVQAALDAAVDGVSVCLAPGVHAGPVDFLGKAVTVEGVEGSSATTLDGGGLGPVVRFASGEGATSELRGVTVTGGVAAVGAGVRIEGASPTLLDVLVTGNAADDPAADCRGVGLDVEGGHPLLLQVEVRDNLARCASVRGVGVAFTDAVASAQGLWVLDNLGLSTGPCEGGGLALDAATADLANLDARGNACLSAGDAALGGGLALLEGADGEVTNGVFAGNAVEGGPALGGGLALRGASTALENLTVAGNTAGGPGPADGGGLSATDGAALDLRNAAVTHNLGGGVAVRSATAALRYGDLRSNTPVDVSGFADPTGADGNLAVDPGYVDLTGSDPLLWDLTLASGSPLIDAGDPAVRDADNSASDIGAYGGPYGGIWFDVTTLAEVRAGAWPLGWAVEVRGLVVTGVWAQGFTAQDPAAPVGITVWTGGRWLVRRGWEVTVMGTVSDYYGEAQLAADDVAITGYVGEPAPAALGVAEAGDEAWEGVLVTLVDAHADALIYDCAADDPFCADGALWSVASGAATPVLVWDRLYEDGDWSAHIGTTPVTGVMAWRFGRRRILPRDGDDL